MITTEVRVHLGDLQGDVLRAGLMRRLLGRVFHCTSVGNLEGIKSAGAIVPNDGSRQSRFGSTNSYFLKRGCVSLFDYRAASLDQIDESIWKCYPFDTTRLDPQIAFLFLSPSEHAPLIPWTKSREEGSWEKDRAIRRSRIPRSDPYFLNRGATSRDSRVPGI